VALWSAVSGELLLRIDMSAQGAQQILRVCLGGAALVTGGSLNAGSPVVVWDLSGARAHRFLRPPLGVCLVLEVSPCGRWLAGAGDHGIFVWNLERLSLHRELAEFVPMIGNLAITAGGVHVVGSASGVVYGWSGLGGQRLWQRTLGTTVQIALLGERVAAVSHQSAAVLAAATGEQLVCLDRGNELIYGEVWRLAVSPDDGVVAACGDWASTENGMELWVWVMAWEVSTGRILHRADEMHDIWDDPMPCNVAVGRDLLVEQAAAF